MIRITSSIEPVVARQPDARQPQPLLKHRGRVGRQAAGDGAADVEQMRDRDGVGDHATVAEDRPDDGEIAGMRAAFERIVGQEGVARRHVDAEALADEAHLGARTCR